MNLPVPIVGVDTGPDWANQINNCFALVDIHDHSPGYGVPITPSGLDINSDLSFSDHQATNLAAAQFTAQSSLSTLSSIYVIGVDLYFNDGSGNIIRLTQAGSIAGVSGTIANLVSPASATYVSGTSTFVWQSAANTPANMDGANFIFRNLVANSKGLTLEPPAAMAADYSLVLPAIPNAIKIVTIDTSGNIVANYTVDGTTIVVNSNILSAAPTPIQFDFAAYGPYGAPAQTYVDVMPMSYNYKLTNVMCYWGSPGSSGITEGDIKYATTPAGPFTSIFTITPKATTTASANVFVDVSGQYPATTGVTAPTLNTAITDVLAAGGVLRFDIPQGMVDGQTFKMTVVMQRR